MTRARLVVLVGPMGVGKSTVGELLAERLGALRDTDADIVAAAGQADLRHLRRRGRAAFRDLERRRCAPRSPSTRACSRSAAARSSTTATRALLVGQPVVYLDGRGGGGQAGRLNAARPLLAVNPRRQWRELMDARRPLYTEVARAVVATDGRTPEEVAERSSTHWSSERAGRHRGARHGREGRMSEPGPAIQVAGTRAPTPTRS